MSVVPFDTVRPPVALRAAVILSLLAEPAAPDATTRRLRGVPVLEHTLARLDGATGIAATIVLAWDDQLAAVASACPEAHVFDAGPRRASPLADETAAALRWSDGWRGGLLGRTTFDAGFDARAMLDALDASGCDAAAIVDAAAVLVDAMMIDRLVAHLDALAEQPYAFTPGAVGSGAMLLRRDALDALARDGRTPGSLVTYHPDRVVHDPIAKSFASPVAPHVARSSSRLTAGSGRQVRRLTLLDDATAAAAIERLENAPARDALPRDVVVELTTRRATRPTWSMLSAGAVDRPDMTLADACTLFAQLADADDVRVTFAGVGDPLLHPRWAEIVRAAADAGIRAIHVETDLLPDDAAAVEALARSGIDVVSVHLPAAHATTYARLMRVDRMRDVLENVKRFLVARGGRVPILVPTFVKCEANVGEMEAWYDQWIRAVGAAVIQGPSDLSGRIPYAGVADMAPTVRRACRRLDARLTVLSDGTIASCEEDVRGEQPCGTVRDVSEAWHGGTAMLRSLHAERWWDESAICKSCRVWDRP